jgi:hypothetical protein
MGVISFGDDRPVFGSSASFIRGLIDQAIGMHGEKDYLRHLRYQMEWAYNAIYMEELHVDEIREFASAIEPYRAQYLALPDLQEITRESVEELTGELVVAMKIYVAQRVAAGQLIVERDFWTLRLAADTERRLREPPAEISDLNRFVVELSERSRHGPDLLTPANAAGLPLADRLAKIGTRVGEFPDELDHPEAAFRLIEDGMAGDNEELSDALLRHLIPAMVTASAKAGTWKALQRHLGDETRKWAMEHHDFEFEQVESLDLFPSERQRLKDLIEAARACDWKRFKALNDEPHINEEALKESFEAASAIIGDMKRCWILEGGAAKARGNRMVMVSIGDPDEKARIQIALSNIGGRDGGPFSVWAFHPALNWS